MKKIYLLQNKTVKISIKNLDEKLKILGYARCENLEECDLVLIPKKFYQSPQLCQRFNLAAVVFRKEIISEEDLFIELLDSEIIYDRIKTLSERSD